MAVPDPRQLRLQTPWQFWVQYDQPMVQSAGEFATSYRTVGERLDTVADFWNHVNHLPPVGRLHERNHRPRAVGLSLFRHGITPCWEDAAHQGGREWILKAHFTDASLAQAWQALMLACVGETVCMREHITGIRVLDKSGEKRDYRLEVWLDGRIGHGDTETLGRWLDRLISGLGRPAALVRYLRERTESN